MTPAATKLLTMIGALTLWSSAAYADDDHGRSSNRHADIRGYNSGHNLDKRSFHDGGRYFDHDNRDAYNGYHGYQRSQHYRGRARHHSQQRYNFYPITPRYYAPYSRGHQRITFGVTLGGGDHGHHRGHHRHY